MPKKPDPLDNLTPEGQVAVLRRLLFETFGEARGSAIWEQMEPAMLGKSRQLGDTPEPEKNFWKGAWRIHEMD